MRFYFVFVCVVLFLSSFAYVSLRPLKLSHRLVDFERFFNHRLVLCSPVRKILQPPPGFVLTGSEDVSTTAWFCAHRFGRFFNHRLVLCSPVRKIFQPPPGFVLTGSEDSSTTAWFCAHRFEVIHGHHATLRFAGTFGTGASSLVDFDLQLMICRRLLWESSFDVSAVTVIVCKLSSLVSASQTCLQMFHLYV